MTRKDYISVFHKNRFTKQKFEHLFDIYFEPLKRFIYYQCGDESLAEDIIQDTFIKLWEMRDKVDEKNIKALLYKMAKNQLLNFFSHQKVVFAFEKDIGSNHDSKSPDFLLEEKEFGVRFEKVLSEMPENLRVVFLMHRFDKKKYKEIAEEVGITVKGLEKRMSKAISYIREHLDHPI